MWYGSARNLVASDVCMYVGYVVEMGFYFVEGRKEKRCVYVRVCACVCVCVCVCVYVCACAG